MRMLLIGACALLFAALGPVSSYAQGTTTDTVYHLHGTVLNGVTGRPIGRALVASADRRLATMSNSQGQFTLDVSVPPAQAAQTQTVPTINVYSGPGPTLIGNMLALMAQRPGYLPSRRGVSVALDSTADTRNLVLRLMPAASIRGQITANGSEGLRGLRLELLRHAVQDGRATWQMAGSHPVSEDGSFRFTDLQPGEYTVATAEWSPRIFNQVTMAPVSQQYPPYFLGDTSTLDGATKLHLGYGQTAPANLHLRAVPYYSVSIPIQGLAVNTGANVRVASGAGFQLFQLSWSARDGAVEGALPDGDFVVVVNTFGVQQAAAQIPLHVAGAPVVHAPVGLTPTESIPVSVRDERTQTSSSNGNAVFTTNDGNHLPINTPGFFLNVRNEDSTIGGGGGMNLNGATGPVLPNMMPGRYFVQGSAMGQSYISALTCDGVNLMTSPLVVNDSGHTAPIEVTLRDDGGTVSGTVDLSASGVQAARIVLLPTGGSGQVIHSYAGGDGKFQVNNVAPGSYRVFAIPTDQADSLPYLDPQAMRPYSGRGGAVTVMAGQTAQVQAEMIGVDGSDLQP